MYKKVETDFHGRPLSIEVGRMAKQADGAALVSYGETVVLVTVVAAKSAREGIDFFPLTCDYQERTFAAGKIPGGFFKREGRPSEKEILTSRLIDRPIRPLFPDGFACETQVIATVLSHDRENDPDMMSLTGASAALQVSDVPFHGPIAAVRMGRIGGQLVVNPPISQLEQSELNLVVAGSRDGIVMVEGGAKMLPEDVMLEALFSAHQALQKLLDLQDELQKAVGQPKRAVSPASFDQTLFARLESLLAPRVKAAFEVSGKHERAAAVHQAENDVVAELANEFPDRIGALRGMAEEVKSRVMRGAIVSEGRRVDGRGLKDIRPISCEVSVLPRTHGSALFTRGETQALAVATLGTSSDEQKIDALIGEHYKKFMLHYNFPPFSVGEVKFLRSPGRREIGHGALAERAIQAVLPSEEEFPYTIRVVSEVLESNGSSSMATVCGGTLSLMDAGVPIKGPVAGIAMGLIKEGEAVRILSDILGDEDHLGDMDFKVAGTADGITALQMDIKIGRVDREIMRAALYQAREGRLHILKAMGAVMEKPRTDISAHAPRIVTLKIRPDKIRDVIGPGGKVIRGIIEETGVKIDVEDDGTVLIASSDGNSMQRAIDLIQGITAEAEVGKIYKGTVRKIVDFGAFVEILPGTDGLLHISQIGPGRVNKVTDVLKEGDVVMVKVLEVDKQGKIRLSRKEAMQGEQAAQSGSQQ
ncbi:MAG TPA: polyribonucleotide nucleotidyltransferase [Candidatus Margulisiibacteriota bacterium]|nr:polyribonucleotide nucleotidyltransferase [Candidatus Margulisiibacteriota bacterium]